MRLPYERLSENIWQHIEVPNGMFVLQRGPFRWRKNGEPISGCYESWDMDSVLRQKGWEAFARYGDHLAIARDEHPRTMSVDAPHWPPTSTFKELREDGWPLCPNCGCDELYSSFQWDGIGEKPPLRMWLERMAGCYYCGLRYEDVPT